MLILCPHPGGDMLAQLMKIPIQPFDYQYLSDLLKDYRYPRNKISRLISSGELIPLKQGIYILSELYHKPLVLESVANLLYGPSYVSTDYALSSYGLIPERAYNITSVTTSRRREYQTPLGKFIYQQIKPPYYSLGYETRSDNGINYLMAVPEKALCDKLYLTPPRTDLTALEHLLFDDIRISRENLQNLQPALISRFSSAANSKNLSLLEKLVSKHE